MCQTSAEGGKKCAEHTSAVLESAILELDTARKSDPPTPRRELRRLEGSVDIAMFEYATTPSGLEHIKTLIAAEPEESQRRAHLTVLSEVAERQREFADIKSTAVSEFNKEKEEFILTAKLENLEYKVYPESLEVDVASMSDEMREHYYISVAAILVSSGFVAQRWLASNLRNLTRDSLVFLGYKNLIEVEEEEETAELGYMYSGAMGYDKDEALTQHIRNCRVIKVENLHKPQHRLYAKGINKGISHPQYVKGNVTCECGKIYRHLMVYRTDNL